MVLSRKLSNDNIIFFVVELQEFLVFVLTRCDRCFTFGNADGTVDHE